MGTVGSENRPLEIWKHLKSGLFGGWFLNGIKRDGYQKVHFLEALQQADLFSRLKKLDKSNTGGI